MAKQFVTNNSANQIVMGGVLIPSGGTMEVPDWDSVKDTYPVKKMEEAGSIVLSKTAPAESDGDAARTAAVSHLKTIGVEVDESASTKELRAQAGVNSESDKATAKEVETAAKAADEAKAAAAKPADTAKAAAPAKK